MVSRRADQLSLAGGNWRPITRAMRARRKNPRAARRSAHCPLRPLFRRRLGRRRGRRQQNTMRRPFLASSARTLTPLSRQSPLGYSAAALTGSMNLAIHLLRRFKFSRYIASNSTGAKEWVEGRLSNASHQALSRGNFSM
jgi:hypothetical protein